MTNEVADITMEITAQNPADIDGTPGDVAKLAVAEGLRATKQLAAHLEDVGIQVRNGTMQQSFGVGGRSKRRDPHTYWETSEEYKVWQAVEHYTAKLTTALSLLARVQSQRPPSVGEDEGGERPSARAPRVGG